MIRYALICNKGHDFESWFKNSVSFDKQAARGLVTCPVCGSAKVEKAIMAPRLSGKARAIESPAPPQPLSDAINTTPNATNATGSAAPPAPVAMMSPQEQDLRQKLKELREHLTRNADYVGTGFPEQARKMHYGEIERRSIYGEASPDDAKELYEEGIEFHPLPTLPDDQN
jgi:hypothetical protein